MEYCGRKPSTRTLDDLQTKQVMVFAYNSAQSECENLVQSEKTIEERHDGWLAGGLLEGKIRIGVCPVLVITFNG